MTTVELPRWSAADIYSSLTSREFVADVEALGSDAGRLTVLFDEHGVGACPPRPVSSDDGHSVDAVVRALNDYLARHLVATAYTHSFVSTDSFDEHAQSTAARLTEHLAKVQPLTARLAEWVAALGVDELCAVSTVAAEHRGALQHLADRATHQMTESEEGLYSALRPTGSSAWSQLHADTTSQLTATLQRPEGPTVLPMSTVRGLATDPDPDVRRAALDAELAAWPQVAVPCAAALNAIKGEANVVNARRGWDNPIDASLFANRVSRPTFEAMQRAVVDLLPDLRRWMRLKAAAHGTEALSWADLIAPHPSATEPMSWTDGVSHVRTSFAGFGTQLAGLVDRALEQQWIDAEPRNGKRGGAFCMPIGGDRSMVFLNWTDSTSSMLTLAHELGHAYHNVQLAECTPLQRQLPMALAETASIFCETIALETAVSTASPDQQLVLLDADLSGVTQLVVDIHSRLLFEQEVFAARRRGTVGPDALCTMMRAAQLAAYGDGLDHATAHPYMWAVKPHYYSAHFYNWPYTYGLLFGVGLFAVLRDADATTRSRYDDMLSRVGVQPAEELAAEFGFDVTADRFWRDSTDVIRRRIARYEQLST
jgi:oligoendopeptidase F